MAEDITKIGPVGLKGLKGIGQQQQAELSDYSRAIRSMSGRGLAQTFVPDAEVPVGMQLAAAGYGESTYDDAIQNVSQLEDIQDIRAQEQPWYAQLGAGIGKGVALAATTFLDGTVGLVTGIVEGIGAKISGDSWGDSVAKLWDNEVSNGLASLNKSLEEILPNYRTQEEQDNPWYQNLGTMNFWADSVIKNLGFTVGAFHSGGAWNKALKAVGALKGAMGAKITGSVLSAINEGRIEANHGASDFLELEYQKIDDSIAKMKSDLGLPADSDVFAEQEARLKEDAKERANTMGLTTLIGNTVLLSLDNFDTFGKLYARGYKNARTIAKGRVTKEAMSEGLDKAAREVAQEEAGKRISKEGGKYVYDEISKKRAIARGIRHGLVEGNEEMAQAFISETAGQMQSPDSPDAYYEALLDPTAEIKTRDFIGSVTDGFVNTYGNGDRWEEFAVGAFIGLLGIPTFGKVQNSDVNTWLGRGRTVGISGGLFGEFGIANKENMEGQEAVDFMNNYAQRAQEQKGHFVRSQSFTDAMDGWAKADDAFEYKNAEDNSDFAAISRFAKVGRINDLRDMVNQDFENIPDEELAKIAEFTSPVDGLGGWRNMDGSLMSDTEEGRAQMREELKQKRDKILTEIDKYEKSVETVRAIGNNSLTEDQINELAWLNWKVGTFTDRYNSIKEESQEFLAEMQGSLQAFQSGRGRGMIDEKSEEGQKILKAMDNAEMFIDALRSSKTPLQLAAIMEANPHITQFIEGIGYPILEDIVGVDAATFEKSMTDLKDAIKIAKATKTFNQRYKEFRDNPIELIKNRQKIDKKKEKVNKAAEDVNLKDKVDNADVSEIVHGMESGDLDEGQLDGLFSAEDNEFLNNVGTEGQPQPSGRQKVEEAKKIIKTSQRMDGAIDGLDDGSIDPQALVDAHTLLQHSKQVSESEQEMLDTASQAYNDPTLLYDENDPSMQGVSQEELESILGERIDAAKSVIEQAKAVLSEQNDELDDLPEGAPVVREITPEEAQGKETGHDATEHTPTENERQKAEAAQRAAQALSAEEQAKVNDLFQDLKEGMPQENVGAFDKAVSEVLKSIDMLIDAKATNQEIGKFVKNTQSYQIAKQLAPELDDYLNVYVTSRLNPKATEPAKQEEEPKIATPVITDQEVRQQTTAQRTVDPNQGEFTGTYQYWKPTTSYLPFGRAYVKGDNTPFYKIARTLKNQDGTPAYSEPTLRRIEAVGKYLEEHGAFKLVDSGAVKVGSNVHFTIDSTLNDQAGELVILMTDDQGRVIGDVMSPTDPRFANQLGLPQLVERITAEYKEAGSPQHFTSKEVTTVDKNMVGKIPYLADHEVMHTLNEVFVDGEQQVPFKIGVAANSGKNARILASAGRTKKQGQSDLERSINPPLTAKAGQPFLLLPTSSSVNAYMTVPIMMDSYSPATQGTALGKAIHKVLEGVPTSDNAHAMGIINDLEELLSVQEIHINYNGDNVKVTIKPNDAEHQMTIYNGAKNAPNIVEQLELGLQGQPFQVSRKYINEDYDGQDYNRIIGEVAKVNLPVGTTHTVSDWFTIKPINADGQKMKTKSPRSTGSNPHAATPQYITITKKGMALNVNPATWEVTDSTGKVYTGPNTNKVKAQAFGMYMNKNMEQPYDTEWGYYDPKIDEFVEKPNGVLRTLEEPQQDTSSSQIGTHPIETPSQLDTPAQLEGKAKKAGLLGNKVRQALWQILSPKQQSTIANKKGPKQKQWMDVLEIAFDPTTNTFDEAKLKGTVDEFLGRKGMYRKTDGSQRVWDKQKETKWLASVLPNLSTDEHFQIVNGLIRVAESSTPDYAYGQFKRGVMVISDQAARGTVYHEAFHAVTHTLLTPQEYKDMFDAAKQKWGDIPRLALEENLAEDFRRYVQLEETPVIGSLVKIYRTLKHLVQNLFGKEPYLNKIFYNINRGKLANRSVSESKANRYRYADKVSELEHSIKSIDQDIQSIRDQRRLATQNKAAIKWRTVNGKRYAQISTTGYLFESEALRNIPSEYRDIVTPIGIYDGTSYRYYLHLKSKEESDREIKQLKESKERLKQQLERLKDNKWDIISEEALQEQEEAYYRRIEQYHTDKMMYNNLSQDDKDYLTERGITPTEYSQMTQLEKEVLFHCKY